MKIPRIVIAALLVPIVFLVGCSVFREPQRLCFAFSEPGTVLTVRGVALTSTHVPVAFSVPTGKSDVTVVTADGTVASGTLSVFDARSPEFTLDNAGVQALTRIDFCNFMSVETYAVEENGVITVYRASNGIAPTGFTLTRAERDGILAPVNAIVSPNGVYVAYITWDPAANATVLGVAEVDGKNPIVLASLTPEHGEIALDELSWSGSERVAYAEVVPLEGGPDADGNTRQKNVYRVNVKTLERSHQRIELLP